MIPPTKYRTPGPGRSLAERRPDVVDWWHPNKNGDLTPDDVTVRSHKRVWWVCPNGHEWDAVICGTTKRRRFGCPIEQDSCRIVTVGVNSLADMRPDIAAEWHPTKNAPLSPTQVRPGSGIKVWWLCPNGHEWFSAISGRAGSRTYGCPNCNPHLVSKVAISIAAELSALTPVMDAVLGENKVRTETGWSPDIVLDGVNIAIDIDGSYWHKEERKVEVDTRKIKDMRTKGWTLIRVREHPLERLSDNDILCGPLTDIKGVVIAIMERLEERWDLESPKLDAYRSDPALWARDQSYEEILRRGFGPRSGKSLADLHPYLISQWHPTLNEDLTPYRVSPKSHFLVWWQCPKGHEWQTRVYVRIRSKQSGCPVCAGQKVVCGINSLHDTHPDLAAEWHPTKNNDLTPQRVTANSHKRAWWICKNGHEWQTAIHNRARQAPTGCPRGCHRDPARSHVIAWPPLDELIASLEHQSMISLSRQLGVSYSGLYYHINYRIQI